ncbi:MAG: DUF4349 domain-containing protein [Blautia sp.]|nr:DUF4349 domain-containing protein [Blautia sp.]
MKRELWKSKGFLSKAAKGENGKSRRIYPVAMAAAMTAALLFSGCGAAGLSTDSAMPAAAQYNGSSASYGEAATTVAGGAYDTGYMEGGAYDSMTPMESSSEESKAFSNLPQDRKLIRTVDLEVETKEFERMMTELEAQVQELGGYIENMETYNGSSYTGYRSSRWANLAIRIPREALNSFLENMSVIGNVVRRSDSVEDVTLNYVDMESRRDTLKAEQARLLELLEKAETVEDMIALEERLSNVRYGLESMESQLRTIDNQVDYSTVNLYLSEVKELTPVEEKTDLQRITEGFVDSLKEIGNGIKEGAIWFVVNIPYLVIWAAVVAAAAVILRKWRRKRKEKKAALKSEAVSKNTDGAEQPVETGKGDPHK